MLAAITGAALSHPLALEKPGLAPLSRGGPCCFPTGPRAFGLVVKMTTMAAAGGLVTPHASMAPATVGGAAHPRQQ